MQEIAAAPVAAAAGAGAFAAGVDAKRPLGLPPNVLFDELGMVAFPKTSGSKGVHVYLRIAPSWTFTEVRHAAVAVVVSPAVDVRIMLARNWAATMAALA